MRVVGACRLDDTSCWYLPFAFIFVVFDVVDTRNDWDASRCVVDMKRHIQWRAESLPVERNAVEALLVSPGVFNRFSMRDTALFHNTTLRRGSSRFCLEFGVLQRCHMQFGHLKLSLCFIQFLLLI